MRPFTPRILRRRTKVGSCSKSNRYMSEKFRLPRAIRNISSKPLFVIMPTLAPLRSSIAFKPRVVPCIKSPISESGTWILSTPSRTACAGFVGVVGTLKLLSDFNF